MNQFMRLNWFIIEIIVYCMGASVITFSIQIRRWNGVGGQHNRLLLNLLHVGTIFSCIAAEASRPFPTDNTIEWFSHVQHPMKRLN